MSEYIGGIRDHYVLGQYIGKKLVDITDSDEDEKAQGINYVVLMFEDGKAIKFTVTTGFEIINAEEPNEPERDC